MLLRKMSWSALALATVVMISLMAYGQTGSVTPANVGVYINKPIGPGIAVGGGSPIGVNPAIAFLDPSRPGHVNAMIGGGAIYSSAWMVISGSFDSTIDATGIITPVNWGMTGISTMAEFSSDIAGPTIITKAANADGSYNLLGLDRNNNYTFTIEENGALQFGAGKTRESMDLSISRTAGPAMSLSVQGTPVLKISASAVSMPTIPQSGGARYACFDSNSNLVNSPGLCTDVLLKAVQAQQVEIDALKRAVGRLTREQ